MTMTPCERGPARLHASRPQFRRRGATIVEYSLMLALIAVVLIAAVSGLAQNLKNVYATVNAFIVSAVSSGDPPPPPSTP